MKDDWPDFRKYDYATLLDVYESINEHKYPDRKAYVAELIEQGHGKNIAPLPDSDDSTTVYTPTFIDPRYDTFWGRFFAVWVDGVVLFVFAYVVNTLMSVASAWMKSPIDTLMLFDVYVYSVVLHSIYGQTIGKYFLGVKVVDFKSESPIGFKQAFLRDSVPIALSLLAVIILPNFESVLAESSVSSLPLSFQAILWVSVLWSVLEIVTMLMNDKRRALHDFIAGTVVVNQHLAVEVDH